MEAKQMTDGKKTPPVASLQQNVSAHFDNFFKKYSSEMNCGRGCSQCCIAHLTVFPVEAQLILDWFTGLSVDARKDISKNWKAGEQEPKRCVFLSDNLCGIYEVRPTVCRTQGLPLKVAKIATPDEDAGKEFELSLCELNFRDGEKIPPVAEWLDLERLNTLLAVAQKFSDKSQTSREIDNIVDVQTRRVELSRLRTLLLQKSD
jgi:Fe-S-cluster containining protein